MQNQFQSEAIRGTNPDLLDDTPLSTSECKEKPTIRIILCQNVLSKEKGKASFFTKQIMLLQRLH